MLLLSNCFQVATICCESCVRTRHHHVNYTLADSHVYACSRSHVHHFINITASWFARVSSCSCSPVRLHRSVLHVDDALLGL
jgi:alpha-tubulin suppressor-like RCC1 family protein